VLGLQGSSRRDARVAVAHDAGELNLESRDALALLRNGAFHRVSQLARRNSCGFLLGEARVDGGESRFQRAQILALNVCFCDRARKIALARCEGLTLRELRGLEGCNARVALNNVGGERDDGVVQESGVAFYLADLLVTPRKRSAQVVHLFVEGYDAGVARAQLRLQFGNFLRAAAQIALQFPQAHFAVAQGVIKTRQQRIEDRAPALKRAQRLQISRAARLQFTHFGLRGFHCAFARGQFGIERTFARMQRTGCRVTLFDREPLLLAACFGLRQRRA
jgi:hypothetical protein